MNPEPNAVSIDWKCENYNLSFAYVKPGTTDVKVVGEVNQSAQELQGWYDLCNEAIRQNKTYVQVPGSELDIPLGLARTVTQRINHDLGPKTFEFNGNSRLTTKWLKDEKFIFVLGEKDDADWRKGVVTGIFDENGLKKLLSSMLEWSRNHTSSPVTQASSHLYIRLGQFASFLLPPEAHLRLSPVFCGIVGKELEDYLNRVDSGKEVPVPGFGEDQFPSGLIPDPN